MSGCEKCGIVVIGRNEGERLKRCLESVLRSAYKVVYVDSGSSDGSVELARRLGVAVVELDMSVPFSAARARNAGCDALADIGRDLPYVQFVDGDCEVAAVWLEHACAFLDVHAGVAAVCGRRRERFPDRSIYNLICDMEWDTPIGEALSCGGDAMMRLDAFRSVGGYAPDVTAGEEPELCMRLRAAGWTIWRVDCEMTLHDAAMSHFSQWWKRNVRTGYGAADMAMRFGHPDFRRISLRAGFWAFWAVVVASLGVAVWLVDRTGLKVALLGTLGLWVAQYVRIGIKSWRRGKTFEFAAAYSWYTMLGVWPQLVGMSRYLVDRVCRRQMRLIEYKRSVVARDAAQARPGS